MNQRVKRTDYKEENRILNRYLLIGWAIIAGILVMTYALEVIKQAFTLGYYLVFLCVTVIPYVICFIRYEKIPDRFDLRYEIIFGYFIMYGFVLLSGHTMLTFTYIFPLLSLLILYHDSQVILLSGISTAGLNILMIISDWQNGRITVLNSRDYEIQLALIFLCFGGCYMASYVYGKLSELSHAREMEVMKLQEERIILEERNRYALLDGLTGVGNRRKFDEYVAKWNHKVPQDIKLAIIDVNNLKSTNDNLGHMAGDELIVGVANALKSTFVNGDCYRYGGDEFVVISKLSEDEFRAQIEKLRENLSTYSGIYIKHASAAVGIACADEVNGGVVEDLLKIADDRMYKDKANYYSRPENDRRKN